MFSLFDLSGNWSFPAVLDFVPLWFAYCTITRPGGSGATGIQSVNTNRALQYGFGEGFRLRDLPSSLVYPRNEHDFDARETVRILKLNEKLLRDARARVYQEVVRARDELSPDEFRRWMGIELQRDPNNMLHPFWGTKRYLAETTLEA